MAFRKHKLSAKVLAARKRIDGIRSIDPRIDLGNGLTDDAYLAAITKVDDETNEYNTFLAQADGLANSLKQSEKELGELSQRMLNCVGSKYGYNCIEYKKAGGMPKGEKKRPAKKNGNQSIAA
jgi:hypothetical protein